MNKIFDNEPEIGLTDEDLLEGPDTIRTLNLEQDFLNQFVINKFETVGEIMLSNMFDETTPATRKTIVLWDGSEDESNLVIIE
jgi:hypothetical protein